MNDLIRKNCSPFINNIDYGLGYTPSVIDSPETEIARNNSSLAAKLLDKESERRLHEAGSCVARDIVNTYLATSSDKNASPTYGVDVDVKAEYHTSSFFRSGGFSMQIRLRKR